MFAAVLFAVLFLFQSGGKAAPTASGLKADIERLSSALTKRDLATIRSQISDSRIYVEMPGTQKSYLSNSQTVVVLENFMRTRDALQTRFDLVTDDGQSGSATGTLQARMAGRIASYKLNLGFVLSESRRWILTRISIR